VVCGGIALAAVLTGALVLVTGPRDWFVADSPTESLDISRARPRVATVYSISANWLGAGGP
jgi:hypothetical protein